MNTTLTLKSFSVEAMDFHNRVAVPLGDIQVRINERVNLERPGGVTSIAVVCQISNGKALLCLC